ncbi:MAG: four helix bundle protein [Patescibacteria group bacterium]|jgi:four helix bundle protein
MLFRFREFKVYQDAQIFRADIYKLTKKFPKEETFCLTAQLRRAVISIILNIAEGSNRLSDLDFRRFLNLSLTSLEEVVACLDIALEENYITEEERSEKLKEAEVLGKQLLGFIKKLEK